ncbi:hypothetical protein GGC47_005493 [Bosea sp. OAE752]
MRYVAEANLFTIPDVLVPFSAADAVVAEGEIDAAGDADDRESQSRGQ